MAQPPPWRPGGSGRPQTRRAVPSAGGPNRARRRLAGAGPSNGQAKTVVSARTSLPWNAGAGRLETRSRRRTLDEGDRPFRGVAAEMRSRRVTSILLRERLYHRARGRTGDRGAATARGETVRIDPSGLRPIRSRQASNRDVPEDPSRLTPVGSLFRGGASPSAPAPLNARNPARSSRGWCQPLTHVWLAG